MNYVTLVNNTIQESGADLVEFETDGSDWNSYANTDMKSRFKTWVKRAWRSIQQEAFDWEWMSEQAIVNCVPGIHFYSPDSITWNLSTINPFVLYDVDDSQAVPDKTAIKVVDLTGKYTNLENFGYVDLLSNNTSPLDFGLKAGGEYFNSIVLGDNASLALVGGDVGPSSDPYVAITGYPSILTAPSAGTTIVAIHLITAESSSPVNEKSYTVNGTTRNSTGSPSNEVLIVDFSDIGQISNFISDYQTALMSAEEDNYRIVVAVEDSFGNLYGGFVKYYTGNSWQYNVGVKFPKMEYSFVDAGSSVGSIDEYGGFSASVGATITEVEDSSSLSTFVIDGVITALTPAQDAGGGSGAYDPLVLTVTTDFDSSDILAEEIVQMSAGRFTADSDFQTNLNTTSSSNAGISVVFHYSGIQEADVSFTVDQSDTETHICYVHSWKSFDWDEETQEDDFVENIREVDQSSFRIIYHEDPIPASEYSLKFVPWESFVNKFDETSAVPSRPVIVTEDNTGRWRFYPPMDRPYTVAFDYVRTPQEVVDFDDEFKGIPEEYQDVIMWKALQYYGAYDEQPSVVARATKNYKEMMYRVEMQEREKFHFKPVRLF